MSLVNSTVSKLNGDLEHDYYIMLGLMQQMKIDCKDIEAYNNLYLALSEEVNEIIDCVPVTCKYSEEEDMYLRNIEVLQSTIESFYITEDFNF